MNEVIKSGVSEPPIGLAKKKFTSVDFELDPRSNQPSFTAVKRVPISEAQYLLDWGIGPEEIQARERDYDRYLIQDLSASVGSLRQEVHSLRESNDQLLEGNKRLISENQELKTKLEDLFSARLGNVSLTKDVLPTEPEVPSSSEPEVTEEAVESPTPENSVDPDSQVTPEEVQLHNGNHIITIPDENGGTAETAIIQPVEQETQNQPETTNRRRRFTRALAALALATALGIGIYNLTQDDNDSGKNPSNPTNTEGSGSIEISTGSHVDFYSTNPNHRLTAVQLPKIARLKHNSDGTRSIVGNNGVTIVKHAQWDRGGNLSKATRNSLRNKGYTLVQGKLGQRYMTVVSNG